MLHLTQAIWFHPSASLPGGLGDARFNNLVLEHGFQSLQGAYDWTSPGQFYPATHTLGMSDSHIGTLPLYVLGRFMGLTPERAMQGWFLVVALLNLLLARRLLAQLTLTPWLQGPITVLAFAGVPWVWMTGTHAQLLPIFPALWGTIHGLRFWNSRRRSDLLIALAALLTQFAAGPYLAFFTTVIWIGLIGFGLILRPSPERPASVPAPGRFVTGIALGGAVLGLINLWLYFNAVQSGTNRPMQEVVDLTPSWASWLSAPPVHLWWPTGWPGGSLEHSEHVLFAGFLPGVLSLWFLGWGIRHRTEPAGRAALISAATAWLIILFIVCWPGGLSLWVRAAEWIEPLRAFRAIGRIHILTHALMLTSIGLGLSAWLGSGNRSRTLWSGMIVSALLTEGIAVNQPAYPIQEAVARRTAVIEAWQQAGNRPVLAFAPGFTNQPDAHVQLDAWSAALATQRYTLNGYTGGAPLNHLPFIWNPSEAQARALLDALEIPPHQVSMVTQFPPDTATALGYQFSDVRPLVLLNDFDLQPVSWHLFTPLEHFRFEDTSFYQFTPPSSVRFRLPAAATKLTLITGMRPGAFAGDNDSDGYQFTVSIEQENREVMSRTSELINPRDNPAQRGFLHRQYALPPGTSRELVLEFGPGPANSNAWDWPLLAKLRID